MKLAAAAIAVSLAACGGGGGGGGGEFAALAQAPTVLNPDAECRMAMDIAYETGVLYLLRIDGFDKPTCPGGVIRKVDLKTLSESTLYSGRVLDGIMPYQDKIVSRDASYGVSVGQ